MALLPAADNRLFTNEKPAAERYLVTTRPRRVSFSIVGLARGMVKLVVSDQWLVGRRVSSRRVRETHQLFGSAPRLAANKSWCAAHTLQLRRSFAGPSPIKCSGNLRPYRPLPKWGGVCKLLSCRFLHLFYPPYGRGTQSENRCVPLASRRPFCVPRNGQWLVAFDLLLS